MSIPFIPFKRSEEEYYDNMARGLRTTAGKRQYKTAKEFEESLSKIDAEWAKQGEQ